jgi:putative phosphoribosyl transferase
VNRRGAAAVERPVEIPVDGEAIRGDLVLPAGAPGLVVFAHGSGSGRLSPRNRAVASALREGGLGTLLLDLLTEGEEEADARTGHLRFDIELLAGRLVRAIDWARADAGEIPPRIGLFGSSTGAAAALAAAARRPAEVGAVVSRGGRPDLAGDALPAVRAPTLLVVGGDDASVLDLNRRALERLRREAGLADVRLEIVPRATHLFEEPGALERVAELARGWFECWLAAEGPTASPGAP